MFIAVVSGCFCVAENKTFTYTCDEGKKFKIVMSPDVNEVILKLDGKSYTLPRAISASGARYSDGKVTYWSKGDSAFIDIGDKRVCNNCWLDYKGDY